MQAVFILSLFSLIFAMFAGMSAGLSKNIMQANVDSIKDVKQMFHDVELILTKVIYKTPKGKNYVVDLSDSKYTDLKGSFLASNLGYSNKQLTIDPWHNKIFLLKSTEKVVIWGAKGEQRVEAPITTFVMVSAGPNGRYDLFDSCSMGDDPSTDIPKSSSILTANLFDKENVVGDDIVIRFNNYDAMLDIWERVENVDTMVKNVALDYYKNLVDAFSPLIQLAQRDVVNNGSLRESIFDDTNLDADETCLSKYSIADQKKPEVVFECYKGYETFTELADKTNTKTLVNEWYENDKNKDDEIYDYLIKYRKKAMKYDGKLKPVSRKKVDSDGNYIKDADGDYILEVDVQASAKVNEDFNKKYKNKLFLYPTFDVVEKDANGDDLPETKRGFQNLGLNNLAALDPFHDKDGEIYYEYDSSDPGKIILKREKKDNKKNEWYIEKRFVINALGDIEDD